MKKGGEDKRTARGEPSGDDLDAKIAAAQARLAKMGDGERPQSAESGGEGKGGGGGDDLDAKIAAAQARLAKMGDGERPQSAESGGEGKGGGDGDDLDAKIAAAQARLAKMGDGEAGRVREGPEGQTGDPVEAKIATVEAQVDRLASDEEVRKVVPDTVLEEARAKVEALKQEKAEPSESGRETEDGRPKRPALRERLLPVGTVKRLRVLAAKEHLADVRAFVGRYGPLMGLSSRQTNRLRMCIDEAFTNIFRHAYGPPKEGVPLERQGRWAVIEMRCGREYVDVRCIDWGKEFSIDKSKLTAPDLKHYVEIEKKGGLGLFMINRFTAYWELRRIKNRNVLLMRFKPDFRPETFGQVLRRNLSWGRMSLRVRFTLVLAGVFVALLAGFYVLSVSAQKRALQAFYEARALTDASGMSMNAAQFLREDPDLISLAVLLQEAKNADPAVLEAGVLMDGQTVVRVDASGVSAVPVAYTPPTPSGKAPPRLLAFWRARVVPWMEGIAARMPRLAPLAGWLAFRELEVRTNRGFEVRDFRDAGLLHIKGRWGWGAEVYLTLSKSDYLAALRRFQSRTFSGLALAALAFFVLLAIYWMGVVFLSPLRDVLDEMRRLSMEGLKARVELKTNARLMEVQEIQDLLNTLIAQASESLAETKARLIQAEIKAKESEEIITDHTRMKSELLIGQEIQRSLLPKEIPQVEGYEIGAAYVAATEMGGDYYDFIRVSSTGLGMVVGDVSGHGISSAMMMAGARLMLNALGKIQSPMYAGSYREAHKVLGYLNDLLIGEFPKGMYITMFYAYLDAKRREVNYASAGHNPMILYRGDTGQVYNLNPKGFAIGLDLGDPALFRKALRRETLQLRKGDLLFLYTDGITEAMNGEREEYGERRLIEALKRFHALPAQEIAERLIEDIRAFTGGVEQSDDITFILLKEQASVGDLVFKRRLAAVEAFEAGSLSESAAAKQAGVSTEEFRRLVRRKKRLGADALREEVEETAPRPIDRLDIETSAKLLHLVAEHPEYGVEQLRDGLNTERYGFVQVETLPILRELRRLNLTTLEKRQRFSRREKRLAEQGKRKSVFIRSAVFLNPVGTGGTSASASPPAGETPTGGESGAADGGGTT